MSLKRITTSYSPEEDRLAIVGEQDNGAAVRIWITKRISDQLVSHFIKIITPNCEDSFYAELAAGAALKQAIAKRIPQEPVPLDKIGEEWLVSKVEVKASSKAVTLVFEGGDSFQTNLSMNADGLRNWLSIIRNTYEKAGWSRAGWPGWLARQSSPLPSDRVLH